MSAEVEKKSDAVMVIYRERLSHLKFAQSFAAKGDIPKAVERYKKYLQALAIYHGVTEEKLNPKFFDAQKNLTELFLISHAYWDLAKAYDRAPTLKSEAIRCLDQFAKFTIGFKYQHVNYRMMKKYLRKHKSHNPDIFAKVQKQIQVETKGCYIATMAFGEDAEETERLRVFRNSIISYPFASEAIDFYYFLSPKIVRLCENRPLLGNFFTRYIARPVIQLFLKFLPQ